MRQWVCCRCRRRSFVGRIWKGGAIVVSARYRKDEGGRQGRPEVAAGNEGMTTRPEHFTTTPALQSHKLTFGRDAIANVDGPGPALAEACSSVIFECCACVCVCVDVVIQVEVPKVVWNGAGAGGYPTRPVKRCRRRPRRGRLRPVKRSILQKASCPSGRAYTCRWLPVSYTLLGRDKPCLVLAGGGGGGGGTEGGDRVGQMAVASAAPSVAESKKSDGVCQRFKQPVQAGGLSGGLLF